MAQYVGFMYKIGPIFTGLVFVFLSSTIPIFSQHKDHIGIETQLYSTGLIPGFRYDLSLNQNDAISVRVGYQFIRHGDLGKHDDESGNGYGLSLGYRKFLSSSFNLHFRNDLWWNKIDWVDDKNGINETGKTNILVLQPTAAFEYPIELGNNYVIIPSLAIGFEWNIKTKGEPTGEGAIGLLGVFICKKL